MPGVTGCRRVASVVNRLARVNVERADRGTQRRRPLRIFRSAVASYSALPEPMLARSGRLPASGDYMYEVKWDGRGPSLTWRTRSRE
jgi:ATP-dependent DNA ligase